MIVLHTFGPAFGLPDPSPFVVKTLVLFKLAGVPFEARAQVRTHGAPKGKLPYITDGGTKIGDSTFIRLHLEQRYGVDFDAGYDDAARGIAWSVEKLLEDHVYWLIVHDRWLDDANFARGPAQFFSAAPAPLRPLIKALVRRSLRGILRGQGLGRHTDAERAELARRAMTGIAAILADRPYLLGDRPCGADATVFAFLDGVLCPLFESALRQQLLAHPNLLGYARRLRARFFPELGTTNT